MLLVDDDPTTNFMHQLLLQKMGVAERLLVAENGMEALHTLTQTCAAPDASACPGLILLDVNMPVMGGIEFLEAFQQLPLFSARRPVVFVLTTSTYERELERLRALPIAGIISKPLTREKVTAMLQEHFPA
ncbi:MAG: response regulator [Hymenobacter sp.]|nr:MAG: response regulator [Hymenobacter sp.]